MSNSLILRVHLRISKIAKLFSQFILRRSGETISGRVLLKLSPNALKILSSGKEIVLVSGTNGKTSTSRALFDQVSRLGSTTTSKSGSNLVYGAASALMHKTEFVVLEIDELHLPRMLSETKPKVVLLLNLSRDQLHRMHEVKKVAERWHQAITEMPETIFVIDIDDPFLNFATLNATNVIKVSFGGRRHPDGSVCPSCGRYLYWNGGSYSCECGLSNMDSDYKFEPGGAAYRNLTLANIAGGLLNSPKIEIDLKELERSHNVKIASRIVEIRLTKNPASWAEALNSVKSANVIIVLNARPADGIDTSWLWDVSFAQLKGIRVVVTGERALDMAYRLHVEGIESSVISNFDSAVKEFSEKSDIYALTSYTAYFELVGR
jgi:UDP-N-acetylmuramyl tripeptide synthase